MLTKGSWSSSSFELVLDLGEVLTLELE
ncbi:hypothetical protein LINGRAHAP2_LOCUS7304 [Linum grandiflorum]